MAQFILVSAAIEKAWLLYFVKSYQQRPVAHGIDPPGISARMLVYSPAGRIREMQVAFIAGDLEPVCSI